MKGYIQDTDFIHFFYISVYIIKKNVFKPAIKRLYILKKVPEFMILPKLSVKETGEEFNDSFQIKLN